MNQSKEMCCFCLSVSNVQLINLFTKDGNQLTHFDQISSSLPQLATILNANNNCIYMLCDKCSDTIGVVYRFNQTCLHNVEIYLSYKGIIKADLNCPENEKLFIDTQTSNLQNIDDNFKEIFNVPEENEVKQESPFCLIEEGLNSIDAGQVDIETKVKRKRSFKRKCKNMDTKGIGNIFTDSSLGKDILKVTKEILYENLEPSKQILPSVRKKCALVDKKRFTCEVCGKSFGRKHHLSNHLLIHSNLRAFVCDICGKSFNQKSNLDNHMALHSGEKHKCHMCNKLFSSRSNLVQHKLIHSGEKIFSCDQCGKRFIQKCNLTTHKRVHTGERPYECEVCKKAFSDISAFIQHKRIHSGEKYSCDICSKEFSRKSNLNYHKLKNH